MTSVPPGDQPSDDQGAPALDSVKAEDLSRVFRRIGAELSEEMVAAWQSGEELSTAELLRRHPHLSLPKHVILDLAYEEICRRRAAHGFVDPKAFSRSLPEYQKTLQRLVHTQSLLKQFGKADGLGYLEDAENSSEQARIDWPVAGDTLSGFHLLDELGRGSFARVYLAREPALGERLVVVKVSRQGAAEAETLGKLQHPNVVPVHSVACDAASGLTVICMPFLGQATLLDVLDTLYRGDKRPQSARDILAAVEARNRQGYAVPPTTRDPELDDRPFVEGVIHLAAQLAEALAYTHACGMCHSDIKPSNVLMDGGGRPMLLDFNLALGAMPQRNVGGTPAYMAPEQLLDILIAPRPGVLEVDPRGDLFALGVVIYQLLTGELPFCPIDMQLGDLEMAKQLYERERHGPIALRERNEQVEPAVAALVEGLLSFEVDDRPETAADLAEQLLELLSRGRRARRWLRRHRVPVGLALTAVVGLGVAWSLRPPLAMREWLAAQSDVARGDYARAAENLAGAERHGLKLPPAAVGQQAQVHYVLARRAVMEGRFGEALAHCDLAIRYGLDDWKVRFYRGRALQGQELYREAHADFSRAHARRAIPQLYAAMGDCDVAVGELAKALAAYDAAVRDGFAPARLLNNRGNARMQRGQFERARADLDAAVELEPGLQAIRHNRAILAMRASASEPEKLGGEAMSDIEQAISLIPASERSARLHYDAAKIFYAHTDESADGARRKAGTDFLLTAIELGYDPALVERDDGMKPALDTIRSWPEYGAAVEAGGRAPRREPKLLLDSVAGFAPE